MRATRSDQNSQLRTTIDRLRSALLSRLAVFRDRKREEQLEQDLEAARQAYIEQVSALNVQVNTLNEHIALLTDAAAEWERKVAAIRVAHAEQVSALNEQVMASNRHIGQLTEAAVDREMKAAAEVQAITAAHREQFETLTAHIAALTDSATESARQRQQQKETDYQLLMIHQNLLAEFRDMEPDFVGLYDHCKSFTMTSVERLYSLYKSVEYLCATGLQGDFAECGVWRGGSCMLMALALLRQGDTGRRIFMFDTFDGHPRPDDDKDVDIWGNRAVDEWQRRAASGTTREWGFASIMEARTNLLSTGYPEDRLVFVKGMIEQTVSQTTMDRLALLRLDADWYETARTALHHLYPRLAPGGVVIIDDYGHYKGQRQAVEDYFGEIGCTPLLHRIDYSCRVMVKPPVSPAHCHSPSRRPP